MKKKYTKLLLFTLFVGITLNSCDTIKKVTTKRQPQTIDKTQDLSEAKLIKRVQAVQPTFKRAYVKKMSANLQAKGRELSVQATCKMVQDSAIHLSIQPFMGIELFKVELTPKSMLVVDKMNKIFYKSNYGIFYELLGIDIDYDEIEALISNRFFVPNQKVVNINNFTRLQDTTKLTLVNQKKNLYQAVTINETNSRIATLLFKELVKKWTMQTNYSNFKQFDDVLFPQNIDILATGEGERVRLQFQIKKVLFDKRFTMKKARLRRYRQGDIRMLLKK